MPALRTIALVVIAVWGTVGHAAGLGQIRVQSALGQSLRASVPVLGADMPELTASCIKVRLEQPDGVPMMAVHAAVLRDGEATSILLSTPKPVNEPAVMLSLQVTCANSIQRTYQLLLDPVLILPQLPQSALPSQAAQPARAASEIGKGRLRGQAMIAAAGGEDGTLATVRRAAARKARSDEQVPAAARRAAPHAVPKPAVARQESGKAARSVLKLSSDDIAIDSSATFSSGLKLSDTLSESRDTGDAQGAAELKRAYDRFAAVLRDEDPLQNGEKQIRDMQAKLQELESQTARLKEQGEQQRQADLQALARASRDTVSSRWVVALGVLLLAALGAIGWLYRRVVAIGRKQSAGFWERASLDQHIEPAEWKNTLDQDDMVGTAATEDVPSTDPKPSDWERGIPLDDTLAVDWASRQATLQGASLRMPAARAAVAQHGDTPADASADSIIHLVMQRHAEPVPPPARQEAPNLSQAAHAEQKTAVASSSHAGAGQAAAGKRIDAVQPMEVEEISGLMQEAEFWMLLNDPERAIDILEPCLHVMHPVSPVPWIYLLDLYRITGRQENYQMLAARIKKVFNASAPAWADQDAETPPRSLRDYPHVVTMIEDLWEGEEIVPYLESLLLDEREGDRAGFDLAVYREIIHLISVARDPQVPRQRGQLNFDDPQPRLISQKVSMPAARPAKAVPLISDEEAAVFDRATSQLATARQAAAKAAAPKAAAPEIMPPQTPVPASASENLPVAAAAVSMPAAVAPEDAERMADMARKLDLVLAYQEIGENVGARVLLEEVIQGGSPLQVEKARAMLKKLLKEIDWQ